MVINRESEAFVTLLSLFEKSRPELESATLSRVRSIPSAGDDDPGYLAGLHAAVSTAFDYASEALSRGEENCPPPPLALLSQARLAARHGVGLATVLRRYMAGFTILMEFAIDHKERRDLRGGSVLRRVLGGQAAIFDRLLEAVSDEYSREAVNRERSAAERKADRVARLLGGEQLETSSFDYSFAAWHVGIVVVGGGAESVVREAAKAFDCRLLLVTCEADKIWAWLGSRHRPDVALVMSTLSEKCASVDSSVALGEPAEGMAGWRLTHRQAASALLVAQRDARTVVRYSEVALLASALSDDLLATSLKNLFIAPLEFAPGGVQTARATLRAYFYAERNVTSAASTLRVKRHTVTNRLRAIESLIDRSLASCAAEMEAALRLEELSVSDAAR